MTYSYCHGGVYYNTDRKFGMYFVDRMEEATSERNYRHGLPFT